MYLSPQHRPTLSIMGMKYRHYANHTPETLIDLIPLHFYFTIL